MDEIFNNIFVYLPIILIILFRILGARNRPARKKPPVAAAPRQGTDPAWAEPAWAEPARADPAWTEPARVEPARVEPAPAPQEKPPEKAGRPRITGPIPQAALFPDPLVPASPAKPAVGTGRPPGKGFPGNLDYLPALKRAMVLAELMGPPKALQGERNQWGFEPPGGTPPCVK